MEKCDVFECSFYKTIDILKGRFVCALIISLEKESKSFGVISSEFSYLTNTVLSRTLKDLIDEEIIVKEENNYALTEGGIALIKIINDMEKWYDNYGITRDKM